MDLTLLELHFPNAEFNAPFAGRSSSTAEDDAATDDSSTDRDPSARLGPLAVLLGLAGLALLSRYLHGSEADPSTLDEVEA